MKAKRSVSVWKNEEGTPHVVFVINFFLLPQPQGLNAENKVMLLIQWLAISDITVISDYAILTSYCDYSF